MERFNEMERGQLLKGASPEPWKTPMKDRIRGYTLKYSGMELNRDENLAVAKFVTSAPGHTTQIVYIQLEDFWAMWDANLESNRTMSVASLLNMVVMHGDIKVYCTCPSWLYGGYKYMASQLDYAYYQTEPRAPRIRNPKMLGSLCKHAYIAVKALPYQKFGMMGTVNRYVKAHPEVLTLRKDGDNNDG